MRSWISRTIQRIKARLQLMRGGEVKSHATPLLLDEIDSSEKNPFKRYRDHVDANAKR